MSAIDIKIVSLRNRFPIDLVIGSFFYFRKNLEFVPNLTNQSPLNLNQMW
ncbi:hypothetical protein LEP1GSC008_0827 [Leptospira kirschneri serovar Bulgarica str. Nikolaevo]|uniref:Uncharacterized protein n=2 Tax=Leptospira kirschneri TaxID=29507 RepID=A0A0E2B7S4_9LEPT|nr:hypothetical protein LEP1GSC081_0405 [Leptospira kirschneri str. H1]EMK24097.1 hypothetical protein LEP1GSC008_0827 [Leptospira kirschneri serovar Bulgarica str. Nikolaevo]